MGPEFWEEVEREIKRGERIALRVVATERWTISAAIVGGDVLFAAMSFLEEEEGKLDRFLFVDGPS